MNIHQMLYYYYYIHKLKETRMRLDLERLSPGCHLLPLPYHEHLSCTFVIHFCLKKSLCK
jgi:hypothetical protein